MEQANQIPPNLQSCRQTARLIVWLLAAASAALGIAVVFAPLSTDDVAALHFVLPVGLAQVALLSAWLVWGRRFAVLRLLLLLLGIAAWAHLLWRWNGRPPSEWMFMLACYAAFVVVPLIALRLRGNAVRLAADRMTPALAPRLRRQQYSLWSLLSLMTGVAVVLGFRQWVEIPWTTLGGLSIVAAGFGLVALVGLLAPMGLRRAAPTLAAIVVVCLLVCGAFSGLGGTRSYLLVTGLQASYLALAMTALRAAGVALRKMPAETTGAAPPPRVIAAD